MIKRLKYLLTSLAASLVFAVPVLAPVTVHAQLGDCEGIQDCLNEGTCEVDQEGCVEQGDAGSKVNDLIRQVINIISLVVGVVAVVMVIYGGFKYITSGGEGGNVSSAKNTILYAIIGLVIVALAQVIVRFVLSKTTE